MANMSTSNLDSAMSVRAEAMRLAIECGRHFDDASFEDLKTCAEKIEQWLHEAAPPRLLRAKELPAEILEGTHA